MDINLPFYVQRRKIITDHLDRFPDAGSLTIAKIIYRDYSAFFSSLEDIRGTIRYFRGTAGEERRRNLANKKYVK
jgi:hypothetical protein